MESLSMQIRILLPNEKIVMIKEVFIVGLIFFFCIEGIWLILTLSKR